MCFRKGWTAPGQGGSSFKKAKPKRRIGSPLKSLCSIVQASPTFLFCGLYKHILYLTDKYHSSLGPSFHVYFHAEPTTLILKSNTPTDLHSQCLPSVIERKIDPLSPKTTKILYFFKAPSTSLLYCWKQNRWNKSFLALPSKTNWPRT